MRPFNLFELYMNKFVYNLVFLFLMIILGCVFPNNSYEEAFVPKIVKQTYRPVERNIRRNFEGFYSTIPREILEENDGSSLRSAQGSHHLCRDQDV